MGKTPTAWSREFDDLIDVPVGANFRGKAYDHNPETSGAESCDSSQFVVTYVNEKGLEVVAQAKLQSGDYVPLMATDFERLASMPPAARDLATTRNINMRLVKFKRVDMQDIVP
jgi:hypothetical protein